MSLHTRHIPLVTRIGGVLQSCLRSTTDYLAYLAEEMRNAERNAGWEPGEMTRLLNGHKETVEERELARTRRKFWDRLKDGSQE